jgi:Fic family protein
MTWNWQQSEWPEFAWDGGRLRQAEERFLVAGGSLAGTIKHLEDDDREQLVIDAISLEALKTSEIEGEFLDRVSVQSSIRRQLGLATDRRRVPPAEQGIGEMMVDVCQRFDEPLGEETLCEWHRMLTHGRTDLTDIGLYRTGSEPMQVVSGATYDPRVHFEAPPSARVPDEMARFVEWFNRTTPAGSDPLPAVTRAGLAHLYIESIHPFEDGNGRLGRAVSEKALAQALGQPTLTALAATILIKRRAYYDALEAANKQNEVTDWLAWFAAIILEAQQRATARVAFVLEKTRLLDRLRGQLNERQEKVLLRMLREGPEGFRGGLSASNYMTITGATSATATRDLGNLVAKDALTRKGERRHTRYHLAIVLRAAPSISIDEDGNVRNG